MPPSGRALEVVNRTEVFGPETLPALIARLYCALEHSYFCRASEKWEPEILSRLGLDLVFDPLLGQVTRAVVLERAIFPAAAAAFFAAHAFRLLHAPPDLRANVRLCLLLDSVSDSRSAVVHLDLTTESASLVAHHSLALAQSTASRLGLPESSATDRWLSLRYASAAIQSDALAVLADASHTPFFISLAAAMLPYADPPSALPFLSSARAALADSDPLSRGLNG
jgi:hypothetical protein